MRSLAPTTHVVSKSTTERVIIIQIVPPQNCSLRGTLPPPRQGQQHGAGIQSSPTAAAWLRGAGQQQQQHGAGIQSAPTAPVSPQGAGQQQQQHGAGIQSSPTAAPWCELGADMTASPVASPAASWLDGGGSDHLDGWVRGGGPGYGVVGRLGQGEDHFCELSMNGIFSPPEGAI